MALWDSPHQREAYEWFAVELANLRTAFRWAADQNDLDAAAAIAGYGGLSLVIWSRTMSRSRGPKSSLRPLTSPITRGSRSCT